MNIPTPNLALYVVSLLIAPSYSRQKPHHSSCCTFFTAPPYFRRSFALPCPTYSLHCSTLFFSPPFLHYFTLLPSPATGGASLHWQEEKLRHFLLQWPTKKRRNRSQPAAIFLNSCKLLLCCNPVVRTAVHLLLLASLNRPWCRPTRFPVARREHRDHSPVLRATCQTCTPSP